MNDMNWHCGSIFRNDSTSMMSAASTVSVSSPYAMFEAPPLAPSFSAMWVARSVRVSLIAPSPLDRAGAADLLLQEKNAVEQRLGGRRAAGHVDVDRHD